MLSGESSVHTLTHKKICDAEWREQCAHTRKQSTYKNMKPPLRQFEAMPMHGHLNLRSKEEGDAGSSLFLGVGS